MVKDAQFNKFIKYKKYKDIYDFNAIECKIALICSVALAGVSYLAIKDNTLENINILISGLTKDIAVALISFLGFAVSGLAILTGVVSKKEVQSVVRTNKVQHLEKILLSFYLLGLVIATSIVGLFCCFILGNSNKTFSWKFFIILILAFSYLISFILFYAVKLVGNCLEVFFIVNSVEENSDEMKIMQCYNTYRITALERAIIPELGKSGYELYKSVIKEQIDNDANICDKEALEKLYNQHFNQK